MRILYVCTANVCRSRSAEALLSDEVRARPELAGIEILSAGTWAVPGSPGCTVAPALAGRDASGGARRLDVGLVTWADLVLTAEREHRSSVVTLDPAARRRAFTIRQAGRLADWLIDSGMVEAGRRRARAGVVATGVLPGSGADASGGDDPDPGEQLVDGDPRIHVEPLGGSLEERRSWVVHEMDAARAMAIAQEPEPTAHEGRRPFWRRRAEGDSTSAFHGDDLPDPHVMGMPLHATVDGLLVPATASLVRLLREVANPEG